MNRLLIATLLSLMGCFSACHRTSNVTAETTHAESQASSSTSEEGLSICRPSASMSDWEISCEDLERWSQTEKNLGLDCLDEPIWKILEANALRQDVSKNELLLNPSPSQLQSNPKALAIYAVEIAKEEPRLQHDLLGLAKTVPLNARVANTRVIIIDRNLLRWMGAKIEELIKGYQQSPNNRVGVLTSAVGGGFGTPIQIVAKPDALSKYCNKQATSVDIIVLSRAIDGILWTLRHELHHAWRSQLIPLTHCPTKDTLETFANLEIDADNFAIDQIKDGDMELLLSNWLDWRGDEKLALGRNERLIGLQYYLTHHLTATIAPKQMSKSHKASIAARRLQNMVLRGSDSSENAAHEAAKLAGMNALRTAQECPSKGFLEQQCKLCNENQKGCQAAVDMAWTCSEFMFPDSNNVNEHRKLRDEAFDHLRANGFQITRDLTNSKGHVQLYRVEKDKVGNVLVGFVEEIPFPRELGVYSEVVGDLETERTEAFLQGIASRDIGGLTLLREEAQGNDPQPVVNALLAWETNNDRKDCKAGDATACHRFGIALVKGRGFKVDEEGLKAARFAFERACSINPSLTKSCSQLEQLRELLASSKAFKKVFPNTHGNKKHAAKGTDAKKLL